MSLLTISNATLDDLMQYKPRAELINGRIVPIMPHGYAPMRAARMILRRLETHAELTGVGEPVYDNAAYGFDAPLPSGRLSISPDASFYEGPPPPNRMKYIRGFPVFAAEVRSDSDYGPKMDREYDEKRNDYFYAGTTVVWDVDPMAKTVSKYTSLTDVTVFQSGDLADAEPALPGFRVAVDDIFKA